MKRTGRTQPGGIIKWCAREDWRPRVDAVMAEHFEPAMKAFGLDFPRDQRGLGRDVGRNALGLRVRGLPDPALWAGRREPRRGLRATPRLEGGCGGAKLHDRVANFSHEPLRGERHPTRPVVPRARSRARRRPRAGERAVRDGDAEDMGPDRCAHRRAQRQDDSRRRVAVFHLGSLRGAILPIARSRVGRRREAPRWSKQGWGAERMARIGRGFAASCSLVYCGMAVRRFAAGVTHKSAQAVQQRRR